MFKHRSAQVSVKLLIVALAVALHSFGGLLPYCLGTDENANLARFDGNWTVVTVNGAAPIRTLTGVTIASPKLEITVSCNRVSSTGILRQNMHFEQTSGVRSPMECNESLKVLDQEISVLMGSNPLFTEYPDGTLAIEAAPYALVLRRK